MHESTAEEINQFIQSLDPGIFKVAFFIKNYHAGGQDKWMDDLSLVLRQRGYFTIALIATQCIRPVMFQNVDACFRVDRGAVRDLRGIQVFIITDTDFEAGYPDESRVLVSPHHLTTDIRIAYNITFPAVVDGYIINTYPSEAERERIGEYWTGFVAPEYNLRKQTPFYLIPAAYMSLAHEIRQAQAHGADQDAILYAPTRIGFMPEWGGLRIREYGAAMISYLLKEFPDFKIIFRPYNKDLEHPDVIAIAGGFSDEKNFIFDQSSYRDKIFARSAVAITDLSTLERTFPLSTLRGAVTYQPWRKGELSTTETEFGYQTADLQDMGQAIRELLAKRGEVAARILKSRNEAMIDPESAFESIADSLEDFYHLRARPEWITIERCNRRIPPLDFQMVRKIQWLGHDGGALTALRALCWHNSESPLLAAFAFHSMKLKLPSYSFTPAEAAIAADILNSPARIRRMTQIPLKAVRSLYYESLQIHDKYLYSERMPLVYELLQEFEASFPSERKFSGQYIEPSRKRPYNGWAIAILPRLGSRLTGIRLKCIYLRTNKKFMVRIFLYGRNEESIELSSLTEVYQAEFTPEELDITESQQEVSFPLGLDKPAAGQPYLIMVEGDGFIGVGTSANDLKMCDYMFRGYRSFRNEPGSLRALWGTDSIAYELIYEEKGCSLNSLAS